MKPIDDLRIIVNSAQSLRDINDAMLVYTSLRDSRHAGDGKTMLRGLELIRQHAKASPVGENWIRLSKAICMKMAGDGLWCFNSEALKVFERAVTLHAPRGTAN